MRRSLRILACSLALAMVGPPLTATALASGTGTSAGDQQYVDPLSTTTTPGTAQTATTTPTTAPPSSPATPPAPSTPASTTSSAAPPTTSSAADAPTASGTLPFTGLNVGECIAVGLGLLGGGLALRRVVGRA